MVKVSDRVSLKVFAFIPVNLKGNFPFVIVSGLATMIDSFLIIIGGLSKFHPVYYVETRDKTSSVIQDETDYSIQAMGMDVSEVIEILKFKDKEYYLLGYSLGSAVIADAYRHMKSKPRRVIFMEPTAEFNYPGWSLFVIRHLGTSIYSVLKRIAKWYLLRFVIDKKQDRQMMVISFNSLDHADPVKLKNTILSVAGYSIWDRITEVRCPSLIVGTTKDGLHNDDHLKRMLNLLEKGTYIDLETNERTHNEDMVDVITRFISSMQ